MKLQGSSSSGATQPKGKGCWNCGKSGHRRAECSAPPNDAVNNVNSDSEGVEIVNLVTGVDNSDAENSQNDVDAAGALAELQEEVE